MRQEVSMAKATWLAPTALAGALLTVGVVGSERSAPARIEVGTPFPDILLPAPEDGRPLSVRAFRGQKVVRHVFASW
jgi:hypothetical protein